MIVFNNALLERRRRVTVKYTAAPYAASIFFKCHGSGKLTSIVCEDHRKEKFEALNAQEGIKSVKDIRHGACGIGAAEKGQHERRESGQSTIRSLEIIREGVLIKAYRPALLSVKLVHDIKKSAKGYFVGLVGKYPIAGRYVFQCS